MQQQNCRFISFSCFAVKECMSVHILIAVMGFGWPYGFLRLCWGRKRVTNNWDKKK